MRTKKSYLLNNHTSSTTNFLDIYSVFLHNHQGIDTTLFVADLTQLFHNQETTLPINPVTPDKPLPPTVTALLTGHFTIVHMIDEINEMRDSAGRPTVCHTGLPT